MKPREIQQIINGISYKDWNFKLGTKGNVIYLQVRFKAEDNDRPGEWDWHHGRKWMLSKHMTKSEIVQTALKAVLTAEEHEARERFKFLGEPIFGPHFDVVELFHLASGDSHDVRDPIPDENIERPENEIIN